MHRIVFAALLLAIALPFLFTPSPAQAQDCSNIFATVTFIDDVVANSAWNPGEVKVDANTLYLRAWDGEKEHGSKIASTVFESPLDVGSSVFTAPCGRYQAHAEYQAVDEKGRKIGPEYIGMADIYVDELMGQSEIFIAMYPVVPKKK